MAILAFATALANKFAFGAGGLADGLSVGHLGRTDVGPDFKFPQHAVDQNIEV
jgi:hypothetical protein